MRFNAFRKQSQMYFQTCVVRKKATMVVDILKKSGLFVLFMFFAYYFITGIIAVLDDGTTTASFSTENTFKFPSFTVCPGDYFHGVVPEFDLFTTKNTQKTLDDFWNELPSMKDMITFAGATDDFQFEPHR